MDVVRYAEKFESLDGSVSWTFPSTDYQYQAEQAFRRATAPAVGADYAHDYAGYGAWAKELASEKITGLIWGTSGANADTQFDEMASKLRSVGLGKLYLVDQAGARRWAYAKLTARPSYRNSSTTFYNIDVSVDVTRLSDWFATALTSASSAVAVNYESFVVNNAGNAPVKTGLIFQLTSSAAAGFSDVRITNVTTGESIRWRGSARWSGAVLRIDNSDLSVRLDADAGLVVGDSTSFVGEGGVGGPDIQTDAYPLVELGPTQGGFITLDPGNNTIVIQVDGTAAYTRYHEFYAAWE